MYLKWILHSVSLFAAVSNMYGWTLSDINSGIVDDAYSASTGYNVTDETIYNEKQRRGFCELATTGDKALFQSADLVPGDFSKGILEVYRSINVYALKCTEKYKDGGEELWIGIGPQKNTVAVYAKPKDGTGVLVGVMVDVDDTKLPGQ